MTKEQKSDYNREKNTRLRKLRKKEEADRVDGIKSIESNKVVYMVRGSNKHYDSHFKAEMSTTDMIEIYRTIIKK